MIETLTRDELQTVTGTRHRKLQARWLAAHRWPFEVDHFGWPVVLRSVALERLGGKPPAAAKTWSLDESNVA